MVADLVDRSGLKMRVFMIKAWLRTIGSLVANEIASIKP
jgi:hypothetical protein